VSSDQLHPADFLAELASAIKAVRERGGKWNKTADTIQWANDRIVRLEAKLDEAKQMAVYWKGNSESLVGQLNAVESRLASAVAALQKVFDLASNSTDKATMADDGIWGVAGQALDAVGAPVVERQENLPNIHHPKCGVAEGLPFGEGMCICLSIKV
jgi:predicted S18 family serine protease